MVLVAVDVAASSLAAGAPAFIARGVLTRRAGVSIFSGKLACVLLKRFRKLSTLSTAPASPNAASSLSMLSLSRFWRIRLSTSAGVLAAAAAAADARAPDWSSNLAFSSASAVLGGRGFGLRCSTLAPPPTTRLHPAFSTPPSAAKLARGDGPLDSRSSKWPSGRSMRSSVTSGSCVGCRWAAAALSFAFSPAPVMPFRPSDRWRERKGRSFAAAACWDMLLEG
mmetsp:Transcript_67/g.152  ORF Transcript_67/g.152 Transcript_67/m.152 type:complete len:224 (-) Transcript_67:855-1526(-)